jgi:hypothetical protein
MASRAIIMPNMVRNASFRAFIKGIGLANNLLIFLYDWAGTKISETDVRFELFFID